MRSGHRATLDDFQMRIRRREHCNGVDRGILQNGFQAVALGKRKRLRELRTPLRARTVSVGDLHPVGEVERAPGMRRDSHAEPDDSNAGLLHFVILQTFLCVEGVTSRAVRLKKRSPQRSRRTPRKGKSKKTFESET